MTSKNPKTEQAEFVLAFDIPTKEQSLKVRINRSLKRIGARMIQRSIWASTNFEALVELALKIKSVGGAARILEEKLIFD